MAIVLSRFRLHHIFAVLLCICMSTFYPSWQPDIQSFLFSCSSPLPTLPWSLRLLLSHHRVWNAGCAQARWNGMNPFKWAIGIVVLPTGRYVTYSLSNCSSVLPPTPWLAGLIFGNRHACLNHRIWGPSIMYFALHRMALGRETWPVMSRYSGVKKEVHLHSYIRSAALDNSIFEPRCPLYSAILRQREYTSIFPHCNTNLSTT